MDVSNNQPCKIDAIPEASLLGILKTALWYILPVIFPFILYRHLGGFQRPVVFSRQLKGQVVLITGASSGLGEALAHVFYRAGSKVILASRRVDELDRVKKLLIASKQTSTTFVPEVLQLDLTDLNSIPAQAAKAIEIHDHIDIIVNNAGISHRGAALHTTPEVDIKVMTVNYFGQVALTKALLPGMISRRRGHVVAIGSVQGLIAIPYRSAYSASKHALQAFCDSLRSEVADYNIKVTVVSPGYIRTRLSENALTGDGRQHGVTDSATADGYPPEDVAAKVLEAVVAGEPERVISSMTPRIAIFLRHSMPWLYFRIMERRARRMREETSPR